MTPLVGMDFLVSNQRQVTWILIGLAVGLLILVTTSAGQTIIGDIFDSF